MAGTQHISELDGDILEKLFAEDTQDFTMCGGKVSVTFCMPQEDVMLDVVSEVYMTEKNTDGNTFRIAMLGLKSAYEYGHFFVQGGALNQSQFRAGMSKSTEAERRAIYEYINNALVSWAKPMFDQIEDDAEGQKKS